MRIVNIYNHGRIIHLFTRDAFGKQKIYKDDSFYPFFYEPDEEGDFVGYDGTKLRRVISNSPKDVSTERSDRSYSSDVRYTINYLTHKVEELTACPIKYFFLDIEVFCKDMPSVDNPKDPISCVTIYNSEKKEYKQFFLGDYQGDTILECEKLLMKDLVKYFVEEKPDLWLSWYVEFDFLYLVNRFKTFAKSISPIKKVRMSRIGDKTFAPAGISILDYLEMFKKVNLREGSKKLDDVCEKHLGYGKKHKEIRFDVINQDLKERNLEDVKLMVALEEKFNILSYFDEIRIFSKALWEDLTHNSMIIDSIILNEAKNRNIVLPNKIDMDESEQEELDGAYRRSDEGIFKEVYKADVGSMYPNQLVNFCLDPSNIVDGNSERNSNNIVKIKDYYFNQDKKALLPYLAIKLMDIKDRLKKQLKQTKLGTEEYKIVKMKYDAYKGLVNSLYGVTAFPSFRLYNYAVASSITFLARDLLHYVEDKMKSLGHQVIYTDTDALMYMSDKDETELLNNLVQLWGKKYNKEKVDIFFESEGKFDKILIEGKCHYYGIISGEEEPEIKGMQIKRSSSSVFEASFQKELIKKILCDTETKNSVLSWVTRQRKDMRDYSLLEIAYPCKMQNKKYKVLPIFVRAFNNSKKIDEKFHVSFGENFYYLPVKSIGVDENGKKIDVIAFTKERQDMILGIDIDWNYIESRSIDNISNKLFEVAKWKNKNSKMYENTLF